MKRHEKGKPVLGAMNGLQVVHTVYEYVWFQWQHEHDDEPKLVQLVQTCSDLSYVSWLSRQYIYKY